MSGTRKMEKFEVDAYIRSRLELAGEPGTEAATEPDDEVIDEFLPDLSRTSHPPVRPPPSSGSVRTDEPSVVVAEAPAPPDAEALRTRLARKFVSLADDVTEAFGEFAIGAGAWAVELTAPPGMSTGGGKQALQHLRLRPRRTGYSVIVGGLVNHVEKTAELRDYDHVRVMHEVRFRRVLEISAEEWEQFLRKAEVVLSAAGVRTERVGPTEELRSERKKLTRVSRPAIAVLIVVLALAAVVVWRVLAGAS